MIQRWCVITAGLLALAAGLEPVHAEGRREAPYRRLTLSLNLPYLALPVVQLHTELALSSRWSAALRAGAGKSGVGHEQWVGEFGAQATYYATGNVDRGMQIGLDVRGAAYEGDGYLFGLSDGLALGPFIGYKRVFGSGITLGAQISVQAVLFGEAESEDPGEVDGDRHALPYVLLHAGWSLLPTGSFDTRPIEESKPPHDYHEGFVIGLSTGPSLTVLYGCESSCELEPGLAIATYIGWFVHRRVALVIDTHAAVALFSLSSGFGSFGFGLAGIGAQYWPLEPVWLKATIGVAQMVSTGIAGPGSGADIGGGMTLAVGWELHQSNGFTMDLQARASHGSFDASDPINDEVTAVDTFSATFGLNWQ